LFCLWLILVTKIQTQRYKNKSSENN